MIQMLAGSTLVLTLSHTLAQDWPQWRGPNRDGRSAGFTAPATWPKEITPKWKVTVGEGVATPALVGERLYVFSRQDGAEVTRCLEAATGKELWSDKYDALGAEGPAAGFSGPRSSPTVAGGKVVTLGIRGVLSCFDAASGKLLWRKEDFKGAWPRFFTASSPIVTGGLCIAQLGGANNGGVVAYDLATGSEKWRWTGDAPAYASPVLLTLDGVTYVVAETDTKIVALGLADGKLAWETPFAVQGRGYNAATPIVDGQTLIYAGSGRGVTAVKVEKQGGALAAKELWKNPDNSVQFDSPVLKDGFVYGLSAGNDLFCLNAQDGKTAWTAPLAAPATGAAAGPTGTTRRRRRTGRTRRRHAGRWRRIRLHCGRRHGAHGVDASVGTRGLRTEPQGLRRSGADQSRGHSDSRVPGGLGQTHLHQGPGFGGAPGRPVVADPRPRSQRVGRASVQVGRARCPHRAGGGGLRTARPRILEWANSLQSGRVSPLSLPRPSPIVASRILEVARREGTRMDWCAGRHDQMDAGWSEARLASLHTKAYPSGEGASLGSLGWQAVRHSARP